MLPRKALVLRKIRMDTKKLLTRKEAASPFDPYSLGLSDAGSVARPAALVTLVRRSRATVESWISSACPSCCKGDAQNA